VAVLRRHLVDKVAVSDLCDEYRIQPSLFYLWQRQAFENLEAAFGTRHDGRRGDSEQSVLEKRVAELESKLARKDRVIAEISEGYVQLKKELGEL
jgi:transposase-like protein